MSERRKIVDRMASVHYDAIDEGEQPWETLSFAFRFDVAEQFEPVYDAIVAPLLAEVERLRGEVARQAEQITAVRTIAFDPDTISALEYGAVGSPPNVDGVSKDEAIGYAVDALRDIRAALDGNKAEPEKPFHSLIAGPGPYRCTGCDWHGRWDLMQNAAGRAWSDAHTKDSTS